ncbi:hypothetical protein B0T25DRAFT_528970 [Lasiosphaeria hispida]|uniref:Uncharacterized protein n=1 Tax=Lasiosphaeria hispida TaxID=260671 RepID=A0AAJ0HW60_9PEZI|nr:hypothetical protein B0T25DRAFT_528970 [Lasiosphaeria hispida]
MDTRPIRFEFQREEGADGLKFIHNIPVGLVNPEALAAQMIRPILKEHEAACRAASKGICENCGQPSVGVLQTPMSWLHHAEDPCREWECEAQVRQSVEEMIAEAMAESQHHSLVHMWEIRAAECAGRRKGS